jgi:hypothetical protein
MREDSKLRKNASGCRYPFSLQTFPVLSTDPAKVGFDLSNVGIDLSKPPSAATSLSYHNLYLNLSLSYLNFSSCALYNF